MAVESTCEAWPQPISRGPLTEAHSGSYRAVPGSKGALSHFQEFRTWFSTGGWCRPWWDFLHENKWETRASPSPRPRPRGWGGLTP